MKPLRLIFRRDRRTGQPRLQTRGARLPPPERTELEAEIRRRFERLVELGNGAIVTLETPIARVATPRRFRLTLNDARSSRCPDLLLESVAPMIAAAVSKPAEQPSPQPHWSGGLIAEIEALLTPANLAELTAPQRAALFRARDQLGKLAAEEPHQMAEQLLAGQVALRMAADQRPKTSEPVSAVNRPRFARRPSPRPAPTLPSAIVSRPQSAQLRQALRTLIRVVGPT